MYANKIWSIIVEHSFLMDLSNRWLHNEVAQYIMQTEYTDWEICIPNWLELG